MENFKLTSLFSFLFVGVISITMNGQKFPPISSQNLGFDQPTQLYGAHISGQTVEVDYTKCISDKAKRIQFMMFYSVGDCSNGHVSAFVKISNPLDFHYNKIEGNHQNTYWDHYSESFIFPVEASHKVTIQVERSFGGLNNGLTLYCTGYFQF